VCVVQQVDVLQMSVLEFFERPGKPLYHLENYIDGNYIKYNSNSGFVEENVRFTPQVNYQTVVLVDILLFLEFSAYVYTP